MNSEFEQFVFSGAVREGPFEPISHYDPDGDCIEFIASDESFRRERVDSLVTVYIGRESGDVMGCFIKGVSKHVRAMLQTHPGYKVEIHDGSIRLEVLFAFQLTESYRDPEGTKVRVYKKLKAVAEQTKAEAKVDPMLIAA